MRGSSIGVRLFALAAFMNILLPSSAGAQSSTADRYRAAGHKLYQSKNYGQAARYYLAAVKLNPQDAASYQGLGNCYYAYGKKKEALVYYQRASALQPSNTRLAQFVRTLQAQVSGGAATSTVPSAAPAASSPYLAAGMKLFQQKNYAKAIQYFNAAIKQSPNDYRAYYYAGYSYYMTRNAKSAALYFGIANAKQPNASIKAYADRLKAGLAPADQQWVDSMVARYAGATGTATAATPPSKKEEIVFGVHILGGMEYVLSDPAGIVDKAAAAGSVSLSGFTPSMVMYPQIQPFARFGEAFELGLSIGYFPVGLLSYTTFEYSPTYVPYSVPDVWRYSFNTTVLTVDFGGKILFGDKDIRGYLGLSGGISPISMSFDKNQWDSTNTSQVASTDLSGDKDYTTMAISGQALLGFDINMGGGLSFGPYVGFRYLSATDFKNGSNVLVVDQSTGAVGLDPAVVGQSGSPNIPLGDEVKNLTLDFSGIVGGFNLTFSF